MNGVLIFLLVEVFPGINGVLIFLLVEVFPGMNGVSNGYSIYTWEY